MIGDGLVSTAWLAERLGDDSVRVFDASWFMPGTPRDPDAEYAAGHIPGAVRFDIDAIKDTSSPLPHMLAAPSEFAIALRRLGMNQDDTAVIYDSAGLFSAPRVWWNFRVMGHPATFVLDGGLPRWIDEGRPLETGWRDVAHGSFKAHFEPGLVRDLDVMRHTVASGAFQIVDARPAARFRGEAAEPRPGVRAGHMPGALNVPWAELVDRDALLPREALGKVFDSHGVDLGRPIVTTCGSGVSAALLAFALYRLGEREVAVYDGSWTEWGARDDTQVVTGP
jgi:thiosulfate/3-mercaptopyruvate sulfurtransferase